jgi:N-acetylglucosaminyl-diphospho-decaprenol L-rhamnosyltransferase
MSASVHIVIVNWNTGNYLGECLSSVVNAERTGFSLARVTIVDNASSDDSIAGLEAFALPLDIIRNETNIGFAAACNKGASGSSADYLLFLNPDTRLFPDSLATVVRFMDRPEAAHVGICGAQIVDAEGRPLISCSRFPSLRIMFGKMAGLDHLFPKMFPSHHLGEAETRESRLVDQVIGAFYFVRRDLFAELGGFDERYFLYFEEVDFALRTSRQGAGSYFLKEARVFHAENVSSDQVRSLRLYHVLRSRVLFARAHWTQWRATLLVALTLTVELVARLAHAAVHRNASEASATATAYRKLYGDLRSGSLTDRVRTTKTRAQR